MKDKLLYVLAFPLIVLFQFLFWYSMTIQGLEPKTGQKLYKVKLVGRDWYSKRRGWLNILKLWKKNKLNPPGFMDYSINSMYPHKVLDNISK